MNIPVPRNSKKKITGSKDVYAIMRQILMRQNKLRRMREHFWTIGLNNRSDIMYIELIAIGSLKAVAVEPVEVFNIAVTKKCTRLILIHNHSSGGKTPSDNDIRITKKLQAGGEVLNIVIEDHLIITERNGYYSFADKGEL